ncbi:MAG: Arm DNA-binding domain-containing protein, partial [Hyphomicrobium sp.]
MAQKLTQRFVETVTVGQKTRSEYRDGHTRGLVLRVTPKGIKSWAVLYRRKSDGRKRRYTIGTYPEFSLAAARTQAEAIVALVSRGEDPAARVQARNAALTFEQLAETWVTRHGRPN